MFGLLLMAVGGLIAFLCGLCTVVSMVVVTYVTEPFDYMHQRAPWLGPLILGGIPTAVGAALFWVGRRIYRPPGPRRDHPSRTHD
jgi:hypothetical protein